MTPADLFRKFAALGLTAEQIGGALDIVAEVEAEHEMLDEARKEKGRARIAKWRAKNKEETQRNVTQHISNATQPLARVEDSSSKEEISGKKEVRKERATRLPKDWRIPEPWLQEAIDAGLSLDRALSEAVKMHNWSLSDRNGAKLDWHAAWRNWFRRALESQSRAPPPASRGVVGAARRMMENSNGSEIFLGSHSDGQRLPARAVDGPRGVAEDVQGRPAGYLPGGNH